MGKEQNNTENKTPTLYTYYGKQYDFNDLKKDADLDFSSYLQTLRRGDKDSEELWNAYSNMMSGIGDGSITFENGRFNDSLGRYSNGVYYDNEGKRQTSKRKSRDYYGLVANYIAGKLGKSKEYTPPEDKSKIKWGGNSSLGLAFNRRLFNSDNGNIMDFIDLDPYDKDTKSRKTDNRVKQVKDVTKYLYDNFDSLFTGYSDADSQQAKKYLKDAMTSLEDNTVNSGDYLALSRAFGGINWRNMFNTQQSTAQQPEQTQQTEQSQLTPTQKFAAWVEQNYPKYKGDLKSRSLAIGQTYTDFERNSLQKALQNLQNDDLQRIVRSIITDRTYKFNNEPFISNTFQGNNTWFVNQYGLSNILEVLKNKNLLKLISKDNPNLYYIPGTTTKDNVGWVWDSQNNTIQQMDIRDIPYWRQKLLEEYKGLSSDGDFSWATPYLQNGGILKAQDGTQLWYSSLTDYDPANYRYSYDTSRLVNGDMSDTNFDAWVSNIQGAGVGRYKPSQGNTREYTQGVENQDYYKTFGNSLFNPDGSFTDIGAAWAKAVDANLPKGSTASFYDDKGNLRTSWTVRNQDVYGRNPHTFNNLKDYVNYVRNDQILGARHNVFLNKGNRYFYIDENNQKHWVDPEQISNYNISENPVQSGWNEDKTVYWNDYQLTGLKNPTAVPEEKPEKTPGKQSSNSRQSYVNPRSQANLGERFEEFKRNILGMTPDFIGAGRLIASLRANNRITDTIRASLRPVLKDTYERYSPVTGAFSEMQFRNAQAADLRSLASRAFTSDASLQLASQLDANRQASNLEHQGFLADDREIKRTREASLARQEDNMARRSEVSNFNRASINQTNRERAELAATRLRRNWQSVDNFLQGIEGRMRNKILENEQKKYNTSAQLAQNQYQNAVATANKNYKEKHPNSSIEDMLNDDKYINTINEFKNRYQYDLYNISNGKYLQNPYLHNIPRTYEQILASRNGGQLRPSTMYLINKVIRNESNS